MARRIYCGINTDPKNPHGKPSVQEIRDLGASWVRFTFKDPSVAPQPTRFADYDDLVQTLHQAGINILMILSYETYPGKWECDADETKWNAYIAKFATRCCQIAEHYGSQVQAYEIWNEPDLVPQPGYNPYVPAQTFGLLLKAAYQAVKQVSIAKVVLGGLGVGQPSYLQDVQASTNGVLYADAVGVHPYGRRPTDDWPSAGWGGLDLGLSGLIRAYHNAIPKPLWITEVGVQTDDASFQAEFLKRTFQALNTEVAEIAPYVFWYCWSEGMGAPWGLVKVDGAKKAAYDSFRAFALLPFAGLEVAEATLADELFAKAEAEQEMRFNPDAALQKRIFADGFVPNSEEFDVPFEGLVYRAQRAEHLASGQVRVYYAKVHEWDTVWFISRPTEGEVGAAVVDRPSVHSSGRKGEQVRYIIVHSTDSPVGAPAENTLTYLVGPNDREVSVHELVLPGGQVYRLVPDDRAAHHTEWETVSFPDGTPWQRANEASWGIEAYQIKGKAVGQDVLAATIERVAVACTRFGLDSTRVLGHREVDPTRKSDPVGVDMDEFRAAVAKLLLQEALLTKAEAEQKIQFNPDAALQKHIFADGFVPNSNEFDVTWGDVVYRAQRAEHLGSGKVRVYYAKMHEWDKVQFVERA